jgi:hypothetical protein
MKEEQKVRREGHGEIQNIKDNEQLCRDSCIPSTSFCMFPQSVLQQYCKAGTMICPFFSWFNWANVNGRAISRAHAPSNQSSAQHTVGWWSKSLPRPPAQDLGSCSSLSLKNRDTQCVTTRQLLICPYPQVPWGCQTLPIAPAGPRAISHHTQRPLLPQWELNLNNADEPNPVCVIMGPVLNNQVTKGVWLSKQHSTIFSWLLLSKSSQAHLKAFGVMKQLCSSHGICDLTW